MNQTIALSSDIVGWKVKRPKKSVSGDKRRKRCPEITLYTRNECHLCDDAKEAIVRHFPDLAIEEVDVDTDPGLARLYGEEVPVGYLGEQKGFQVSPGRRAGSAACSMTHNPKLMNLLAFYGFITVISLSGVMSPGPLTAFLIARGRESPWAGLWVTLGHALAEVPLIIALYAGLQPFFEIQGIREGVSLLGGGVLIYLGSGVFRSFRAPGNEPKSVLRRNSITGGVLLTLLNPYWVLWWLTIGASLITRTSEYGLLAGLAGMIIVHLAADAVWAVFVTWSSNQGSRMIGETGWKRIEQGCAWVMLGFGAFFVYDGLRGILA